MKKLMIICITVIAFFLPKKASTQSLSETDVYGYGSVSTLLSEDYDYGFKWARLGAKNSLTDNLQAVVEYDISANQMSYAYIRAHTQVGNYEISGLAGQFLAPVPFMYNGPAFIQTTRWPVTLNGYNLYNTGLGVWIDHKDDGLSFKASHFNSDQFQATVSYNDISVFWESTAGYGIISPVPFVPNTKAGVSVNNGSQQMNGFIQNHVQLPHNVRVYSQLDLNSLENRDVDYLVGMTWTYDQQSFTRRSFVKLYYDSKNTSINLELTFAFK